MATDARAQYLAGLRDLATWLEQNPAQELPVSRTFNVPLTTNSAVKDWAADNGMSDAVQYDKEGNASVSLRFGPIALHMYGYVDFAEHCERSRGRDAREYAEKHGLVLVEAPAATDAATEAFVDAADAERYALRDDYVNATDAKAGQTTRAVEHVDYAEAEAVRDIHEEMALEAAGVKSWDQL